jgi:hypothetical protein
MLHIHLYPHVFLTEEQKVGAWEPSLNRNALLEIGEWWIGSIFHLIMYNVSDVHLVTSCYILLCVVVSY